MGLCSSRSRRSYCCLMKEKRLSKNKEKNLSLEDQLLLAIKRSSLRSIVNCYIEGVDADSVIDSTNGDNPLHIAIRVGLL
jgi:hypothetical protein